MSANSAGAGLELWERELWCDFFALVPVVVDVALEAARLRVIRSGRMASLASGNPGQQDVGRLRARERFLVAAHTRKAGVRAVIEYRMRHPL